MTTCFLRSLYFLLSPLSVHDNLLLMISDFLIFPLSVHDNLLLKISAFFLLFPLSVQDNLLLKINEFFTLSTCGLRIKIAQLMKGVRRPQ